MHNTLNDGTFYGSAAMRVIDARNAMRVIEACGAIRHISDDDYAEAEDTLFAARRFLETGLYRKVTRAWGGDIWSFYGEA